jgi:hypothetical protein
MYNSKRSHLLLVPQTPSRVTPTPTNEAVRKPETEIPGIDRDTSTEIETWE